MGEEVEEKIKGQMVKRHVLNKDDFVHVLTAFGDKLNEMNLMISSESLSLMIMVMFSQSLLLISLFLELWMRRRKRRKKRRKKLLPQKHHQLMKEQRRRKRRRRPPSNLYHLHSSFLSNCG